MTPTPVVVPADRRDVALVAAFAGEISLREQAASESQGESARRQAALVPLPDAAAIARKTDSAPPRVVCAWCPDFDPQASIPGESHGLCPVCEARLNADLDRLEASR